MKTSLHKKKDLQILHVGDASAGTGSVIFRSTGIPYAVNVPEVQLVSSPERAKEAATLKAFDEHLQARRSEAKLMLDSNPEMQNWVVPKDEDFIQVNFRALSQRIIPGHWLDFTKAGVLEESVPLLLGARVIETHWDYLPSKFLGTVIEAAWDSTGDKSDGTPGVNAKLMIDALWNPQVARGLLLRPYPAINESSVKVCFEYELSHPELLEKGFWYYWDSLGEDIAPNGIVRFIVTKITKYPHYALVVEGADDLANQHIQDDEPEVTETTGQKTKAGMNALSIKGAKAVNLTKKQKAILGMPEETPDEVADETVLSRLDELGKRAAIGDQALTAARADVLRDARICEQLGTDVPLPLAIKLSIENAKWEDLTELKKFYSDKAALLFPENGRSSNAPVLPAETATVGTKVSVF